MTDTTDKLIIQSESRGVKETSADVKGLENALGGVQKQSEQTERSTVSMDSKFRGLERSMSTTAGQAEKFAKIQDTVNKAVAQNPELQSRANDVLSAAKARYSDLEKSQEGLSSQGQALFHSIRSVGEQLALGISPAQALTGQINHLSYAMSGQGGVSGAFNEVVGTFGKMLTPMRLLIGGVGGLAAGAIYLGHSWAQAATEVDRALIGIGARSGTTTKDIANFTRENASAAGLSVSEARNAALEFTKTGEVAISGLKGVGDAILGYSILTGKDATEATKTFANAISGDLVKGIQEIDQRYGALNAKTIEHIRTLVEQGDKTGALQVYINAIAAANKRAEDSVGGLTRAWQGFKNVVSNVVNGPAPTSLEDQIAEVQRQIASRTDPRVSQARGGTGDLSGLNQQLEALQQKLNSLNADKVTAQLNAMSTAALRGTEAILPQVEAMRKLDEAMSQIRDAQNTPGVFLPAFSNEALAVAERLKAAQQESLQTTIAQSQAVAGLQAMYGGVTQQTAQALYNLQNQAYVAAQVTGAAQMQAQDIATVNSLLAQGVTLYEAQLIAESQLAVAQAAATAQVEKQVEALKDQNAMLKAAQNGTQAQTAAAIAYKNAIASGADETAAAALKAETLKNNMLQAASAASSLATSVVDAGSSLIPAGSTLTSGVFGQPSQGPSFSGAGESANWSTGVSAMSNATWQLFLGSRGGSADTQIDRLGAFGIAPGTKYGDLFPWLKNNSRLSDKINDLTKSTDKLNNTMNASLNPLYSGRGALAVGYYKAASGLDVIAKGPTSGDQVPFHAMVNGGERIKIIPAGQQGNTSNDNSKTVINNNSFVFSGSKSTERRSARQAAQGFGQMVATLS